MSAPQCQHPTLTYRHALTELHAIYECPTCGRKITVPDRTYWEFEKPFHFVLSGIGEAFGIKWANRFMLDNARDLERENRH